MSNGTIVLVRRGQSYGALIPRKQRIDPETLQFDYYYRTDGKGTFRQADIGTFHRGSGTAKQGGQAPWMYAVFGPFRIGWSGNKEGKGFLYYDHAERDKVLPGDQLICVTNETDIKRIDATDRKWVYKGSPTDCGVRGK